MAQASPSWGAGVAGVAGAGGLVRFPCGAPPSNAHHLPRSGSSPMEVEGRSVDESAVLVSSHAVAALRSRLRRLPNDDPPTRTRVETREKSDAACAPRAPGRTNRGAAPSDLGREQVGGGLRSSQVGGGGFDPRGRPVQTRGRVRPWTPPSSSGRNRGSGGTGWCRYSTTRTQGDADGRFIRRYSIVASPWNVNHSSSAFGSFKSPRATATTSPPS
jgi:hypothetical protein